MSSKTDPNKNLGRNVPKWISALPGLGSIGEREQERRLDAIAETVMLMQSQLTTEDLNTDLTNSIGQQIITAGQSFSEVQEAGNSILLMSGEHYGFVTEVDGTTISGVPGAELIGPSLAGGQVVIEGLTFTRKPWNDTNAEVLLEIVSTAKVLIRNCIFERRKDDPSGSFIRVQSGGKAIITNCMFRSTEAGAMDAGTGSVVNNLGAAGNVHVGIGFNLTGLASVNVTAIAPELT